MAPFFTISGWIFWRRCLWFLILWIMTTVSPGYHQKRIAPSSPAKLQQQTPGPGLSHPNDSMRWPIMCSPQGTCSPSFSIFSRLDHRWWVTSGRSRMSQLKNPRYKTFLKNKTPIFSCRWALQFITKFITFHYTHYISLHSITNSLQTHYKLITNSLQTHYRLNTFHYIHYKSNTLHTSINSSVTR